MPGKTFLNNNHSPAEGASGRLSGKVVAEFLDAWMRPWIARCSPSLAIVLVGSHPASEVYIRNKIQTARKLGIPAEVFRIPDGESPGTLRTVLRDLESRYTGWIVQMPVPEHFVPVLEEELQRVPPEKDLDGFGVQNLGRLTAGNPFLLPATPLGILLFLHAAGYPPAGKRIAILGRSRIVGTPLALLLSRNFPWANGTVFLCHSRTPNAQEITRQADIVVVAVGKPRLVNGSWISPGSVVVDVGIHRQEDGSLCGDVDETSIQEVARAWTPVPGGVGPMTVRSLLLNTVFSALYQKDRTDPRKLLEEELLPALQRANLFVNAL